MGHATELRELDRVECLQLLAGAAIGRVVFTDVAMPAAVPVNYALDDEEIIFRTVAGGRLAEAIHHAVVAFEVDEIDSRTHTGWSVLGIGEAYEIVDPARLARLSGQIPRPWIPGHTEHTISIPLQVLSGRRLSVASWVSDRLCGFPA
jgi:nitroimidazol reductase NimA-like FMN-containing flavoprotein (pyridoxamine 5'-phosphate oxidase superfamily)